MSISQDRVHGIETGVVSRGGTDDALEAILDAVKALQCAREFFNSCPDWYERIYASSRLPLLHDNLQAEEDAKTAAHAIVVLEALKHAQEASQDVLSWTSRQSIACEMHVDSLKLRAGFMMLPDEILSIVLEFATLPIRESKNVDLESAVENILKEATKLSRVCSRFRAVISSVIDIWNRVFSSMHPDTVSSCFSRCGPSGAHIFVSTTSLLRADIFPFSQRIADQAHLWRVFELDCRNIYQRFPSIFVTNLRNLRLATADVSTHLLNRLVIRYSDEALLDDFCNGVNKDALHFYTTWSSPLLQSMFCQNFIPAPFPGTNALTNLKIELAYRDHKDGICAFNVAAIASILSSCQSLTEFSMEIALCTDIVELPSTWNVATTRVKAMELHFYCCSDAVVASFLEVLRFPEVQTLRLLCSFSGVTEPDFDMQSQNVQAALPSRDTFPKLDHLELTIYGQGPYDSKSKTFAPGKPVSIPFSNISHIRSLVLTTRWTVLGALPEGLAMPNLNHLRILNCCAMELTWYLELVRRISSHRAVAATPLRVAVEGTPWVDVVNGAS